jgi:hypothetical protein
MMSKIIVWSAFFALIALLYFFMARSALREKYLVIWFVVLSILISLIMFQPILLKLSQFLGFAVFSNFIFVVFGVILTAVIFHFSIVLSRLEDQNQRLAEEIALINKSRE